MPLDPSILQGFKLPQLNDPLAQYTNVLAARGAQNQLAKYDRDAEDLDILNRSVALNPDGSMDYDTTKRNLLAANRGSGIQAVQKSQNEAAKAALDATKTQGEIAKTQGEIAKNDADLFAKHEEQFQPFLAGVSDPNGLKEYWTLKFKNPVLAKGYEARGVDLPRMLATVDKAVSMGKFPDYLLATQVGIENSIKKQRFSVDLGKTHEIQETNEFGPGRVTTVPGSVRTMTESPSAARTTLTVNNAQQKTEDAYGVEFGKKMTERDLELQSNAFAAKDHADRAKQMLKELEGNSELITGFAAEPRLALAKFGNLVFGTDANDIEGTETLSANLAKDTLQSFKLLGLTGKQMDTPDERNFLERAANGNIRFNRESLIRLAKLSHKAAERVAARWNERAPRMPKSALAATGFDNSPIHIAPYKSAAPAKDAGFPVPPPGAVSLLRKDPTRLRSEFDSKYGPGASDRALGTQRPGSKPKPGMPQ